MQTESNKDIEILELSSDSDEEKSENKNKTSKLEVFDSEDESDDSSSEENLDGVTSFSESGKGGGVQLSPSKSPRNFYLSLDKAVEEIRKGGSLTIVSYHYGIPESVLYDKLVSRSLPDVTTLLTRSDEDNLVKWILKAIQSNSLVFKNQLMERVGKLKKVSRITPIFHKSKYGKLWYFHFLSSHPEIYENEGVLLKCDFQNRSKRKRPVERHQEEQSKDGMSALKESKHKIPDVEEEKRDQALAEKNVTENVQAAANTIKLQNDAETLLSTFNIKNAVVVLHDYRKQKSPLRYNGKENESSEMKENISENNVEDKLAYDAGGSADCIQSIEEKLEPNSVNKDTELCKYSGKNVSNTLFVKYKKKRVLNKDNSKVTCKTCNKPFCSDEKLKRHILRVHNNGEAPSPVTCSKCSRQFAFKYRLIIHIQTTHNPRYFKCEECDKMFKHKTSIRNHYRKKHSTNSISPIILFVCDICGQRFKFKNNLRDHIVYGHQKEEKKYRCDVCQKTFIKPSQLKRHSMRHSKIKPFVCSQCGKTYSRKYLLVGHLQTCVAEKTTNIDLECDRISKEYLEQISLD